MNAVVFSASAAPAAPSAPKDVLEALEQRRAKYVEASNQAKANGDDRKARMHDRIAKVHFDIAFEVCVYIPQLSSNTLSANIVIYGMKFVIVGLGIYCHISDRIQLLNIY